MASHLGAEAATNGAGSSSDEDDEAPILVELSSSTLPQQQEPLAEEQRPPCPVTILSGFLGSGKTTLIKYILQSPNHGKRIAVIENEFGDGLGIESLIARDGVNDESLADLIELPNGCICCTVKDSLVATLENLLSKRSDFDYILIECSGMANPGPIASIFWLDEALESCLKLDGIVTLCDAAHIEEQVTTTEEAVQQIAYADRILLNKVDLIDGQVTDRIMETIRRFHPTAPIQTTTYSTVQDLDWILNAQCFDLDRFEDVEESFAEVSSTEEKVPKHSHHHDHSHAKEGCQACEELSRHKHTANISTVALTYQGTVNLGKLDRWLASILWPNQDEADKVLRARLEGDSPGDNKATDFTPLSGEKNTEQSIFRIKGILSVHVDSTSGAFEEDYVDTRGIDQRRFIVQAVHDLWEIQPGKKGLEWNPAEERTCKLVVIGRFLNEEDLRTGFYSCMN